MILFSDDVVEDIPSLLSKLMGLNLSCRQLSSSTGHSVPHKSVIVGSP